MLDVASKTDFQEKMFYEEEKKNCYTINQEVRFDYALLLLGLT